MTKTLRIIGLIGVLWITAIFIVACNTTQRTVAYKSIASLEQAATGAYDGYSALVIQKTLPTNGVSAASKAFQHFQDSARLATLLAMNNTNALAPAALSDEGAQFLKLIDGFENSTNQHPATP